MASIAMADMAHSLLKQVRAANDLPETVSAVVVAAMQLLVHHSQVPAASAAPAPASSAGEVGSEGDGAEMLAEFDAEWSAPLPDGSPPRSPPRSAAPAAAERRHSSPTIGWWWASV